jgi:hypothetical protein
MSFAADVVAITKFDAVRDNSKDEGCEMYKGQCKVVCLDSWLRFWGQGFGSRHDEGLRDADLGWGLRPDLVQ